MIVIVDRGRHEELLTVVVGERVHGGLKLLGIPICTHFENQMGPKWDRKVYKTVFRSHFWLHMGAKWTTFWKILAPNKPEEKYAFFLGFILT